MGTQVSVWEHQLVWQADFVVGFLVRRTRPGCGKAEATTTWGQRCLVEDRAKPRLDSLGATRVRMTQERPGRTPTQTKPCRLDASEAPIPETGEATLCRSEPGHLSPPESKTHQNTKPPEGNLPSSFSSITWSLEPSSVVHRRYVFARV